MKTIKNVLPKAAMIFLIFTLLCGVVYTGIVTGIAQLIFPSNANGSIIEVDGKKYGSELLGLVNKMSDYNISDDVKYSGYSKMNLSMKITDKTTGNLFSNGTYSLSSISNAINTVMNNTVNSSKYKGQISDSQWEYLAKSSTSTKFDDLCTELKIPSSINREQLKADAAEYYKYVQFKRKKFKHIGTEFSNDGRVSKMSFEETN